MAMTETLESIRTEIDKIDYQILALLHKRMEFAKQTTYLKTSVQDSDREMQVKEKIAEFPSDLLTPEFRQQLYDLIIAHSRDLQKRSVKP